MEKDIVVPKVLVEKYTTNEIIKFVCKQLSVTHNAALKAVEENNMGIVGLAIAGEDIALGTLLALNKKLNGEDIGILG